MEIKVSYVQARRFIDFHTLILNSYCDGKKRIKKLKKVLRFFPYFTTIIKRGFYAEHLR